jgi:predicted phage terminase large subunit-like protein
MRRAGLPVLEYTPDKDKTSRLNAITPLFESGRIYLPAYKQWADELQEEVTTFPYAPHDDQVDALTMAALYLKESWRIEHTEDADWEDDENPRRQKRVAYWRV